jgi:hypothetical protein
MRLRLPNYELVLASGALALQQLGTRRDEHLYNC